MIAYLSGKLLEKQATAVIIDVGGVGYEVTIPLSTFYDLGEVGEDVSLRIFTYVREDTLQLFGFRTLRERELYLKLISVQGIGANHDAFWNERRRNRHGYQNRQSSATDFDSGCREKNGGTNGHRAPR
jgi:hypothetical protein